MIIGLNETAPLRLLSSDGRTDLFPRIHVYDGSGTLVSTLSPTHVAEGMYSANWTPSVEGFYTSVGQFYFDSGFTIDAGYEKAGESIEVNSFKSNVARILGLLHENSVIDSQVYDLQGNMTSARLRSYDTAAHALAAGATGLLNRWLINATYTSGQLTNYSLIRDL